MFIKFLKKNYRTVVVNPLTCLLSTIPTVLKVPSLASNADPIFGKGVGPRGTCL